MEAAVGTGLAAVAVVILPLLNVHPWLQPQAPASHYTTVPWSPTTADCSWHEVSCQETSALVLSA